MSANKLARSDEAFVLDQRPVKRRVGLVVLATDHTTERDFARLCPPDEVGIYANRVAYENPTTPENLRRMQPRLTESAALILPGEPLDAIYYSCTAASVVIGDDAVTEAVHQAKPDVPVITPSAAAATGLKALGAQQISILTPYLPETGAAIRGYFERRGFTVASLECLGLADDRKMARISRDSLVKAAVATSHRDAAALFISCTALRALEVAEEIEQRIGKPVVTSNQAALWRTLRIVGVTRPIRGFGRLLTLPTLVLADG
ncbi:MAG: ectoine utilization protein EutA [Kiloniellales bacterium]